MNTMGMILLSLIFLGMSYMCCIIRYEEKQK
jgi:hypothetical protein